MHATCIGHRVNIIQLSGPEHAVQTVFTPPCPACPAAALDSNLQVSFGNFVGHFRVRAKKKRRQDVPRSNPSSPFNLQFDMHSPDCDFMAFGKTNFAMLLGSGPSKKFNMQSFFKTLRNGLKARRVSYWKTLVWSEINDRSRSGFSFRLLVVPKEYSSTRN